MKHTPCLLAVCFSVVLVPLHAADVQSRWSDLCRVTAGRQLNITTSDGMTYSGACGSVAGGQLSLTVNQRAVKIARSALARIQMYAPGSHHLADLGHGMSKSFKTGFTYLFSPAAPLGIIMVPATVAWGAMAAPFCLLGDMGSGGPTTQDVRLTN